MAPPKPDQPALIPENVLKRKNDLDALQRKRLAMAEVREKQPAKRTKGSSSRIHILKPETILAKARNRRNHIRRVKRIQKHGMLKRAANKPVFSTKMVENPTGEGASTATVQYKSNSFGAKMVFCIRIRNNDSIPKTVQRILENNRMRQVHDGVFLKYDDEMRRQLHLAEPWVVYGIPTASAVKELIERRGHARIHGERIPLSDNTIIENALQEYGILCVDDLVQALMTVDEASFEQLQKFLWPFRMGDFITRYERTVLKLKTHGKGQYGDRGEAIQELIAQVL
jgi:60S ribosomal protein uL30